MKMKQIIDKNKFGIISKTMFQQEQTYMSIDLFKDFVEKRSQVEFEDYENENVKKIVNQICTTFREKYPEKFKMKILGPMEVSKNEHKLSVNSDPDVKYRFIAVIGSHEVLKINSQGGILKIFNEQQVFLKTGDCIKVTRNYSDSIVFSYNDTNSYDKNTFPGKGKKYPNNRYIVILDVFGQVTDEEAKSELSRTLNTLKDGSSSIVEEIKDLIND